MLFRAAISLPDTLLRTHTTSGRIVSALAYPAAPKLNLAAGIEMAGKKGQAPRTDFSQALFDEICELMAGGESLTSICKRSGMPNKRTVMRWLEKNEALAIQYSEAQNMRADHYFDQIIDLADNCRFGSKKVYKADGGIEIIDGDMVERSRLQIDARKWVLARMNPKKYGDKFTQELTGADGGPVRLILNGSDVNG